MARADVAAASRPGSPSAPRRLGCWTARTGASAAAQAPAVDKTGPRRERKAEATARR